MPPDPIEPARNDDRSFVSHLECSATGERYEACQVHGLSAAGKPLLVRYDLAALRGAIDCDELTRRGGGFWKYRPFLPVCHPENVLDLGEVMTPLVRIGRDDMRTGTLLVKDEGRLPTGSFKARGLALAVAMAKELGLRRLAMPTNGNAGAALAAYAARAGLASIVYCPADTPEINIAETALQGAEVVRVDGLIDDCGRLVAEGAKSGKWFDCATLKEPYRIEGRKRWALSWPNSSAGRCPT